MFVYGPRGQNTDAEDTDSSDTEHDPEVMLMVSINLFLKLLSNKVNSV